MILSTFDVTMTFLCDESMKHYCIYDKSLLPNFKHIFGGVSLCVYTIKYNNVMQIIFN